MKKINGKKAAAAVLTASLAGTAALLKKKHICPVCEIKRMAHKLTLSQKSAGGYDNSAALTPPMGWSSWNLFASKINEELIREIADAMKDSGLLDAGYKYVNIDDCWQSSERDETAGFSVTRQLSPQALRR